MLEAFHKFEAVGKWVRVHLKHGWTRPSMLRFFQGLLCRENQALVVLGVACLVSHVIDRDVF